MPGGVPYKVFDQLLTTAGSFDWPSFTGVLRAVQFLDATGAIDLSGLITVKLGDDANADAIPLRYGNAILSRTARQLRVSWDAQAGVTVKLLFSPDASILDVDATPPAQMVLGALASTFTAVAVTVGVTAVVLKAANGNRKSVTIYNNGTVVVYVGGSGVTTATGLPVPVGGALTLSGTTAVVYGISGTAGQDVRVLEEA